MNVRIVTIDKIQFSEIKADRIAYLPDEDTPFTGQGEDFYKSGQKKEEQITMEIVAGKINRPMLAMN